MALSKARWRHRATKFIGGSAIKFNFVSETILPWLTIPVCLKRRCFLHDWIRVCNPGVKYTDDRPNKIGFDKLDNDEQAYNAWFTSAGIVCQCLLGLVALLEFAQLCVFLSQSLTAHSGLRKAFWSDYPMPVFDLVWPPRKLGLGVYVDQAINAWFTSLRGAWQTLPIMEAHDFFYWLIIAVHLISPSFHTFNITYYFASSLS